MQNLNKGFDDDQIISVSLSDKSVSEKYKLFKGELEQNPYIEEITGASFSVFSVQSAFYTTPEGTDERQPITYMYVEENFIKNLGIELSEGEDFNHNNWELNKGKTIVNETAKAKYNWDDSLGKKISGNVVIGVAKDFIYGSAKEAIDPLMIMPSTKNFEHAYVKVSGENVQAAIDHIKVSYDKFAETYPFEFTFLDEDFAKKYDKEKRMSNVFSSFSVLALFVAGLGILGLSIFIAEQRIKEIGIRRVLGARIGSIVWLLNKNTTILIVVVAIIVLPAIHYIMSSWLENFTNRIELGIGIYLFPLVALLVVIWLILLNQSVRSARQNPIKALRTE
jgi:putative ABC transport system permease protein